MGAALRLLSAAVAVVAISGCYGEAEWQQSPGATTPTDPMETPRNDAPPPVKLSTFQSISAGVPTAAAPGSSAHLDGVVYMAAGDASSGGLYALDTGASAWRSVPLTLKGAEKVTSVSRVDTSIVVTVADTAATGGGVFRLDFGATDFVRLANAPAAPAWAVVKKGSTWLLATTGGLFASTDRGTTWTRRSAAFAPLFLQPVQGLWASSAATRILAVAADGTLNHSDDDGATWSTGLVRGKVSAVSMGGQYVLLVSDLDGAQRSDNYGATFHPLTAVAAPQAFALVGERAFAGTAAGVQVSDDGGATWRDASEGLPPSTSVRELFAAGPALIAATPGQIYVAAVQ